jgi:hypothetical protein
MWWRDRGLRRRLSAGSGAWSESPSPAARSAVMSSARPGGSVLSAGLSPTSVGEGMWLSPPGLFNSLYMKCNERRASRPPRVMR